MSRSVNKVKDILLPLILVLHLDGVALDCDAALLLQVHVIEHLTLSNVYGMCIFKQTVSQR